LLLLAFLLSSCAGDPDSLRRSRTPPPDGWPASSFPLPSDGEVRAQIDAALEFRRREDLGRFLDASDVGELLEDATLTQGVLDAGSYGVDDLFIFGDELFDYEFRPHDGLGNSLGSRPGIRAGKKSAPNLRRVHEGEFGGPDSHSCSTCHFKGGPDGAGNNTQNAFLRGDGDSTSSADVRNPPHLLGLGPVEVLAREMTAELQAERAAALESARRSGSPKEVELTAKGVAFGRLTAQPDGGVDAGAVRGVDPDLVVKPFGWKGHQATLRGMVEESFRIHVGIVSMHEQERVRARELEPELYGDGQWFDVDRDGATIEIEEGMLTSLVAYFSQLEVPVFRPPADALLVDAFARGRRLFEEIGCAECHRPKLTIEDPKLEIRPRGTKHEGSATVVVDVAKHGERPKIEPQRLFGTQHDVHLFSDLRRHDMGPALATKSAQGGIPAPVFLTRSLWGLAFTAPYLHDGRAPNVDDAVRLHGGEAQAACDRYVALPQTARAAVQVFLLSLTREPELFVP
jgi:hypothetical protein